MARGNAFGGLCSLNQADESGASPKYEQIRDFVISQIRTGQLQAGEALISEHQLARTLSIARSTVRQAMSALEREGFIRRVHGKGTFIHEEACQRLHQRQTLFALLVPEAEAEFFPPFQKHFAAAAARLHHQMVVCNPVMKTKNLADVFQRLIRLNVSGVAFVPPVNASLLLPHLHDLQHRGIPVVCCCRALEGFPSPVVEFPFEAMGQTAGELLRSHGHRRVLFCAADQPETETWTERGFRFGMGAETEVATIRLHFSSLRAHHCEAAVEREVSRIFDSPRRPTAIFCTFDPLAELFYVVLSKKGLRVPEDVSLVGCGARERTGALTQRLTSITIDESQLGSHSVQLLHQQRHNSQAPGIAPRQLLPIHLFAGRTLTQGSPEPQFHGGGISREPA